ncbi:MAG: alpha/beta fold hydrolase [Solirubrobacterales bacterium]|nr:alpha/beta fold hydrolase [Solirubrobacterales bacterium]
MAGGSRRRVRSGAALAAATVAGAVAERRHLRRIAADPLRAVLEHPPVGRPLRARSADATKIHAEIFGRDGLPTLVLAHGWTERLRFWALVINELPEFRIVAYDLRGHGRSSPAATGDYSLERFGEDLEAVLVVPEGERAIVAGHSLGAMSIAAWAAGHDAGRVRAAALLFTGLGDLVANQLLVAVSRLSRRLRDPVARRMFFGARFPLPRFSSPLSYASARYIAFGPAATPAQIAFFERMLANCVPRVRAAVGLALTEMELHDALPRLRVPTLVMDGADDRLTPPAHGRRIAAELPALYRLIELPDTGHMGPLERPAAVADALRELAQATEATLETTAPAANRPA